MPGVKRIHAETSGSYEVNRLVKTDGTGNAQIPMGEILLTRQGFLEEYGLKILALR